MFPFTPPPAAGQSGGFGQPAGLVAQLLSRLRAGPATATQPFTPLTPVTPPHPFQPAAIMGAQAPAGQGVPGQPAAPFYQNPWALPAHASGGPGGPMGDGDQGAEPPWPGAVVAVNTPNGPIYYGTPQWAWYQASHGLSPQPQAPQLSPSTALRAALQRILGRQMPVQHAAGHGPMVT